MKNRVFGAGFLLTLCTLPALATACTQAPSTAYDESRPEVKAFIDRMSAQNGFERGAVTDVLLQAQKQQTILDAMAKPAEKTLTWQEYRARFITDTRIAQGVTFWEEHKELLDEIEIKSGVPARYVLAIVGVETSWGRITGKHRVIDALTTLAFDYPPRAPYFNAELEQFLLLAREENIDPLSKLGSYAGAMGPPQFMPRSIRSFAVDHDGDGKRDLWTNWPDILASVAHYLKEHGWKARQGVEVQLPADDAPADAKPSGSHNFGVIMTYNRSPLYAMAVCDLADQVAARAFKSE
jgi:membrane-bound lytic murein transglycosylase B